VLACKDGCATYYSRSLNGGKTADGGRLDNSRLTAAHHSYPFGTVVRVTRVKTGKFVEVRVTDRLPSTRTNNRLGIIIDLTHAAASKLDMIRDGRVKVKVEVLEWGGSKGKGKEKELIAKS
jgi:rare lipoprotein A